jgi:hypothetical protein
MIAEVFGIVIVAMLANRLHRPDLATDWCAMVVGVHFLPLAKVFRAPLLGVVGILLTLWCLLCWLLFRSNALVISVTIGTGILLWAGSISALFRAGKVLRSLPVFSRHS